MKVNIEYDTTTKKAVVKMDGKVVEDVSYLCISKKYPYDGEEEVEGEYSFSLTTEQDGREEDGVVKTSSVYADKNKLGGLLAAHRYGKRKK